MTKQEIYDTVCAHLAQQKQQSAFSLKCVYRGPNGLKCAIGCLIPDELYDPSMDLGQSTAIESILSRYEALNKHFEGISIGLLSNLQTAHDDARNPEGLRSNLLSIAGRHGIAAGAEQAIVEWRSW